MSDETMTYAEAKMTVLWDLEDCPVPDGLTPGAVYGNIRTALTNEGHNGALSIIAFANDDTTVVSLDDFESVGITVNFIPEGSKGKRRSRNMALRAHMFGSTFHWKYSNIMVISEYISDITLGSFSRHGYKIVLAQPRNGPKYQIIHDVTAIWFWESLSVGGKPIEKPAKCTGCGRFKGDADALPETEEHIC